MIVIQASAGAGRLVSTGRCVRTTSRIASSVSSDSTNHAVRNSSGAACSASSSTANVRASNTELIPPNSNMKLRIRVTCQRRGVATVSGSTRSPAIAIAGRSDRKLFSRICLGSSGRKGIASDSAAMLSMLPKLALVVV